MGLKSALLLQAHDPDITVHTSTFLHIYLKFDINDYQLISF